MAEKQLLLTRWSQKDKEEGRGGNGLRGGDEKVWGLGLGVRNKESMASSSLRWGGVS